MSCTTNGCTCHMIQAAGEPFLKGISCRGREKSAAQGYTCSSCGVGTHSKEGDYPGMNGLCSGCYYGE
jgi:hypothetical protein